MRLLTLLNRLPVPLVLLLFVTTGLAVATSVSDVGEPPFLLEARGLPVAGAEFEVQVIPLKTGLTLGVLVELNRVRLGSVYVREGEDGTFLLRVPVPAAASSGTLTVTVQAGRQFASSSFNLRGS